MKQREKERERERRHTAITKKFEKKRCEPTRGFCSLCFHVCVFLSLLYCEEREEGSEEMRSGGPYFETDFSARER